ncbi:MAG TPA: ferritin-like protein [Pyrinomonadaceae bacterium]|jgi:hypothetical protein|nr:ferritin-like protein [Pyrinomonadaceae bacterium]
MSKKILDLLEVPAEERGVDWLKESLQSAICLEFATVPVYLCGMWSIKKQDPSEPAYKAIHGIVMDEMFHMALACNMLTTIGGTPQLNTRDFVPKYPGPLPGGVRPSLRIALTGLTKDVLEHSYMQIEYPAGGPIEFFRGETYPTIGEFYDAILEAFRQLPSAEITGTRQLTRGEKLFAIHTLADAEKAITRIKREGEGTSQSPFSTDFGPELAHYYKFGELWHGHKFVRNSAGRWNYDGDSLGLFPEVYPMAEVPAGGYSESADFDAQFTNMLNHLQQAWATGKVEELTSAVSAMRQLDVPALKLIETPIAGGTGNYGPDFRLKS